MARTQAKGNLVAVTTSSGRVRIPKTGEVVAGALRRDIVSGLIPEGAPLPTEAELIDRFGVSRPSIREAFRILESEQLIVVLRGSHGGARATRPEVDVAARYLAVLMQYNQVKLSDVFTARAMIEPMAFRLLAQRRNRAKLASHLETILDELVPGMDGRSAVDTWIRFYHALFEAAGNHTLTLVYGTLTEVLRYELKDVMGDRHDGYDLAKKSLKTVIAMAVDGDGEGASQLWTDKMLRSVNIVTKKHGDRTVDASAGD